MKATWKVNSGSHRSCVVQSVKQNYKRLVLKMAHRTYYLNRHPKGRMVCITAFAHTAEPLLDDGRMTSWSSCPPTNGSMPVATSKVKRMSEETNSYRGAPWCAGAPSAKSVPMHRDQHRSRPTPKHSQYTHSQLMLNKPLVTVEVTLHLNVPLAKELHQVWVLVVPGDKVLS